jgi:hypothetical protein
MEIISIEARTYEAMMSRFEQFARKVELLCDRHQEKTLKQWMDNHDVCITLNISPRTLQTYRDNGTLPYSQVNHKMYYRPEDVQAALRLLGEKQPEHKRKEAPYGR